MRLTHLSLTNFRNFARLDMDVPPGPLLLVGSNAQGKTSLLEAIYFLATFESFHATNDRQLINFLATSEPLTVGRIVAEYRKKVEKGPAPAPKRIEVRLIQETNGGNTPPRMRKEILLDGVKKKASEVIGEFNAVLFLPHMLRIVEGAPEERRRYLNLAMAQVLPSFAKALSEYNQTLTQRNALLRNLAERGQDARGATDQLTYWDEKLAVLGAQVIQGRIRTVIELERLARPIHAQLTRDQETLRLDYQPSFDPLPKPPGQFALPLDAPIDRSGLPLEKIQDGFRLCLERNRSQELVRGVTLAGPHRDELRFMANRIDLGIYGSRGQSRTAVLALKLAEVAWMREKTRQWPVLLLDEVLAELDPERRADLLNHLLESEQSILTTTDLDLFNPQFVQRAQLWNIQGGRLISTRDASVSE